MDSSDQTPRSAFLLGYAGLVPFLGLALNYLFGWPLFDGFALQSFLVYAAVILAFLGGIRWGAAVNLGKTRARELTISVLPALWSAGALLLPSPLWTVTVLAVGFVLMGIADTYLPGPSMPGWMTRLRIQLSVGVVICHLLMIGALAA